MAKQRRAQADEKAARICLQSHSRRPTGPRRISYSPFAWLLVTVLVTSGCASPSQDGRADARTTRGVSAATGGRFQSLFDGKTLTGWQGEPGLWSVEDGAITGRTDTPIAENTFLVRQGQFADFEIRLKYRFLSKVGNSGLQYRSRPDPERQYSVIGYQANVVTTDFDRTFAMLWEERARELLARCGERVIVHASTAPGPKGFQTQVVGSTSSCDTIRAAARPFPEWNDYTVVAYKNRLVHVLNGTVTLDVLDDDQQARASSGFFALQIHRGLAMTVQFKDIEVRPLTRAPKWKASFGEPDILK